MKNTIENKIRVAKFGNSDNGARILTGLSKTKVVPTFSRSVRRNMPHYTCLERIAHTDNKGTALYGYRLYNLYWYVDGNKKTPHALVCTVVQDFNKAEGYVFKNIENVTIGRGLPGTNAGIAGGENLQGT